MIFEKNFIYFMDLDSIQWMQKINASKEDHKINLSISQINEKILIYLLHSKTISMITNNLSNEICSA